jgi:hypothetical protein
MPIRKVYILASLSPVKEKPVTDGGGQKMQRATDLKIETVNNVIDLKERQRYNNLKFGFEFEFQRQRGSNISDRTVQQAIMRKYGIEWGKTNGKGKKAIEQRTYDSNGRQQGSIKIDVDTDLYKEHKTVIQGYHDGSVEFEVVTSPLPLKEIEKAKDVHQWLIGNCRADYKANGRAGFHVTVLTEEHDFLSDFHPLIVQNVIQFCRAFYPSIVLLFGNNLSRTYRTRGLRYRQINPQATVIELRTNKYHAINLRRDNTDSKVWGIEFRFPDGHQDFYTFEVQVRFIQAMFKAIAKWSRYGRLTMSQERWENNLRFTQENSDNRIAKSEMLNYHDQMTEMISILKAELREQGILKDIETLANGRAVKENTARDNIHFEIGKKATELFFQGNDTKEILKSLSEIYSKSERTIRRILEAEKVTV